MMQKRESTPDTAATPLRPQIVIEANDQSVWPDFAELWRYRHLLVTLVERDLRVRYKSTVLGVAWILLQPALQMMIFTLIFGFWARLPSAGIPYGVFVLSGLVQVFFINSVMNGSAGAIRANSPVAKKIYFPKMILSAVVLLSALVDYIVQIFLILAVMTFHGTTPPAQILLLPFIVASLLVMLLGLSLWLTALGARYRDIQMIMPSVSMLVVYLSPVVYPITMVPETYRVAYAILNPFVGYITALKWSIAGVEPFHPWMLGISVCASLVILLTGIVYFVRTERMFNDYM